MFGIVRYRCLTVGVLLSLGACTDPTSTESLPVIAVPERHLWAGTQVTLTSLAFRNVGTGAVLQLGNQDLPLTQVNDTTMTARLPRGSGGSYDPVFREGDHRVPLDQIEVYGYTGVWEVYPSLEWDIAVWPRNGHASIIGTSQEGLTQIDLDSRTVHNFPELGNTGGMRGLGMTYTGQGVLLYPPGSSTLELWSLSGLPTYLRSFPAHQRIPRQAMQLGPDAWFFSSPHEFHLAVRSDSSQPYQVTGYIGEETEGVHMSPRYDRATIQIDHSDNGIPVFDVPSGEVAFFLTQLRRSEGVSFSPEGDLLAIAGGTAGFESPARLLFVNATTGDVVRDTVLEETVFAITFDPVRPLVYVGVADRNPDPDQSWITHPAVLVLDAATFEVLGRLSVPASTPGCRLSCYKGVLAVSAEPALYSAWSYSSAHTIVHRFALPRP